MQVSEIYRYPVKGCQGVKCNSVIFTPGRPLVHDRAWFIVDTSEHADYLGTHPKLALVKPTISNAHLLIEAPGLPDLRIARSQWQQGERVMARMHKTDCEGFDQGGAAAAWFTLLLGRPVRLLKRVDEADGPRSLLLTSEMSLIDLNDRRSPGTEPFMMKRFRPSIVISDAPPWREDEWKKLKIGELVFHAVRPEKVSMITADQSGGYSNVDTATVNVRIEHATFGLRITPDPESEGSIQVGDQVTPIT